MSAFLNGLTKVHEKIGDNLQAKQAIAQVHINYQTSHLTPSLHSLHHFHIALES